MKFIRSVAWIAAVATYVLIALSGVMSASGSGLNCPDWPFCYSQTYYSGTYHTVFALAHLCIAATVGILVVLLMIEILRQAHKDRVLFSLGMMTSMLLVVQIAPGWSAIPWKLPPQKIVMVHLGTALAIFALLITIAVLSGQTAPPAQLGRLSMGEHPMQTRKFAELTIINALLVYILMLFGSYVTGKGAALACPGWPLCTPASWAVSNHLASINVLHRTFAVFVGLVMLWTIVAALRRWHVAREQAIVGLIAGVLFVYQSVVGGLIVLLKEPPFVTELHLALACAIWGSLVLLAALATRQLRTAPHLQEIAQMELAEQEAQKRHSIVQQTIASYVDLMKPHVTTLLLGVTVAAMAIANQGLPALALVVPTLLGGAMAAGSANCINCYIDRDIDQLMGRTQRRSLPAGRVQPRQALIFGIALGVISFIVFSVFVNLLCAVLACSAILFYVFVYTLWLKRSTVQNIVIGGAAGAVPVLVGWAAVTNSLSLTAIWLFVIIFCWTPPHFWALSLLIHKDYEKASIPMLPVVKGEAETRKQILLYSLLLLVVTLLLFAMGSMGYLYLVGATVLGGGLVYLALRLWREHTKKWARTLFWYSNMYLAAIFAIMVVDRIIR